MRKKRCVTPPVHAVSVQNPVEVNAAANANEERCIEHHVEHPHYKRVMDYVALVLSDNSDLLMVENMADPKNKEFYLDIDLARKVAGVLSRDQVHGKYIGNAPGNKRWGNASQAACLEAIANCQQNRRLFHRLTPGMASAEAASHHSDLTNPKITNIILSDYQGMRQLFHMRNTQASPAELSGGEVGENSAWCKKLDLIYNMDVAKLRLERPELLKVVTDNTLVLGSGWDLSKAPKHTITQLYEFTRRLLSRYNTVFMKYDTSGNQHFDTPALPFEHFTSELDLIYFHYRLRELSLDGAQTQSYIALLPEAARCNPSDCGKFKAPSV